MGRDNLYIDLLLYDAPAFMEQASSLLGQYSYPFYLAEFRPESRLQPWQMSVDPMPEIPLSQANRSAVS